MISDGLVAPMLPQPSPEWTLGLGRCTGGVQLEFNEEDYAHLSHPILGLGLEEVAPLREGR